MNYELTASILLYKFTFIQIADFELQQSLIGSPPLVIKAPSSPMKSDSLESALSFSLPALYSL